MLKALVVLSVFIGIVTAQGPFGYPGMPPPGLMPPRVYMIGGELGYHARPLYIPWGGAQTAPPGVRRVEGRIFSEVRPYW